MRFCRVDWVVVATFACCYPLIYGVWTVHPWGNGFPPDIPRVEYAVLCATAFWFAVVAGGSRGWITGVLVPLLGFALGVVGFVAVVALGWPHNRFGCELDLVEWYCRGALPMLTTGPEAFLEAGVKVFRGIGFAVPGFVLGRGAASVLRLDPPRRGKQRR